MNTVTHVMRAPILGGSELETLEIVRQVEGVRHRVLFPRRFAALAPSIADRFPVAVEAVDDIEAAMDAAPGWIHIQFPFLRVDEPVGHESVLELRRFPRGRTLFTVHAAVNVPLERGLHYVFHTSDLAQDVLGQDAPGPVHVAPSLTAPRPQARPDGVRAAGRSVTALWVSRNDDAKFHDAVPDIVRAALQAAPGLQFRFVGLPGRYRLPEDPRVRCEPCPTPDLDRALASADLFWHYPHALVRETWCRTVTEAMEAGLPCAVASWGAMGAQVLPDAGLVAQTPRQMVDALVTLAGDAAARERMGAIGRARALHFRRRARSVLSRLYRSAP